jgi:exopolyphosphatase/guanosine-5'-triphosphate,3'-diphosphate pyrophosphatase
MNAMIPRWEWRTFGTSFGIADERFAARTPEKVQESDETYLLSPVNDANVKIRDDLLDLKSLVEVNPMGLEQWRPVMKATFPLSTDVVHELCTALGVAMPPVTESPMTLARLRMALAEHGVRAVAVHKRRVRYTIDGCTAEMTEVAADGKPVRSVAIESEDADRVLGAVRAMGLDGFDNISYPRALKALVGMQAGKA